MRSAFTWGLIMMLAGTVAGCAAPSAWRGWAHTPVSAELARWVAEHPLAPAENIRVEELERSAEMSLHVVQIRELEPLHVHRDHDLEVMVHRGHGVLHLGKDVRLVEPGSVMRIPRGVAHAFVNCGPEPAVAFVRFRPPFDGTDAIVVQDTTPSQPIAGHKPPRCATTGLRPVSLLEP